jgi:hypothetical protein
MLKKIDLRIDVGFRMLVFVNKYPINYIPLSPSLLPAYLGSVLPIDIQ